MSYKTFSSTVTSGVGWLGDIPSHWAVVPAKALFSLRAEKAFPNDIHLTPSQKFGVLPQAEYMEITGNRVVLNLAESGQMKHVEPNDFVSHLRSFQGGLELSRVRGRVSGAYTVLKPRSDQNPEFWGYALKSASYVQALQTTTDQLRDGQSIRLKEFAQIPLPLVPRVEQDAIVKFLDRELTQIDLLVSKQLELESLLEEKHDGAFLRYLGSPHLPKAGSSAKVQKFKYLLKGPVRGSGLIKGEASQEPGDGLIPAFSASGQDVFIPSHSFKASEPGFVLSSVGARCGKTFFADFPQWGLVANTEAWTIDSNYDAKYVWYLTRLPNFWIKGGSAQPYVQTPPSLQNKVFIPDLEEQKQIVQNLESELERLNHLTEKSEMLRLALDDRRKALISAAVTGKLDILGGN
jgi:type I restriction enzyme S subunit